MMPHRRSRRSLDAESAATFVHAFVASRIDYCNAVLACAPKATTDKLQRVLNAAARVVTGTKKFERGLSRLLHTELHWLDVPERVMYKLSVMMCSCLHGQAPQYLLDVCQPVSDVASRRHLRSASRRLLNVPHQRRSTFARRAFSVAGPSVWNSLPDYLKDLAVSRDTFCKHLKTFFCSVLIYVQRIRGFTTIRYINLRFTYFLTYLLTDRRTIQSYSPGGANVLSHKGPLAPPGEYD